MNTEHIEKFVNALACDLEEGGFRQVSGTTLRRSLTEAVSAALPLLADIGIPVSQPAELAEQQGVELPPLPEMGVTTTQRCMGNDVYVVPVGFSKQQMQDYARAALSAAGKQQVGELQGDALATIIAALEHSKPTHAHYPEPVKRHADALAHARALAARQPVGQEPVLWGVRVGDSDCWGYVDVESDADFIGRKSGLNYEKRPFYAAPPAQAVDRGKLERIRNELHAMSGQVPDEWIDPIVELQRDVQKIIDSQRDSAPGVGNG